MAIYIVKPWYKKGGGDDPTKIYGAEWDGSSNPAWTRTDDAVGFVDPNPSVNGSTGSSPFDNISPWKDMRIVEDSAAGTLVEIPKFYYKWTRTDSRMKLQISMTQHSGFYCSPAHADRGDGVGERDYVYIGRYHCGISYDFRSKTGVVPIANYTREQFRTNIHNLGTTVWQNDFAMWWTIRMLYLVEFAHWNSQLKIGYGCGDNSDTGTMGYTDNMPYHTGTTQLTRDTYGLGTQYRYIEGLWDNILDWVDGIYFGDSNKKTIYAIKNPANFSDDYGGTDIGKRSAASGYTKAWTNPSASGFEYALYPNSTDSNLDGTTYVCDRCYYSSSGVVPSVGSYYNQSQSYGAFQLYGSSAIMGKSTSISSRVMKLPSSRLSS